MDYVNTEIVRDFRGLKELDKYLNGQGKSKHPELEHTKGFLLYREDWVKIYMRVTGSNVTQAIEALRRFKSIQ